MMTELYEDLITKVSIASVVIIKVYAILSLIIR